MNSMRRAIKISILSASFLLANPIHDISAQNANTMRHGDILVKIQTKIYNPGNRGENEVWRFDVSEDSNTELVQEIISLNDSISVQERDKMFHFVTKSDTLYFIGTQRRRSHTILSENRPLMKYPLCYGDSLFGHFMGTGRNERVRFSVKGTGYSSIDGRGKLTDGVDTISNVIRLHSKDDYLMSYDNGSFDNMTEDRYLWFAAGCRYPVMEMICLTSQNHETFSSDSLCFLYLPIMQSGLPFDAENESILAELLMNEQNHPNVEEADPDVPVMEQLSAAFSADLQTVEVDYLLNASTDLFFSACDLFGNILAYKHIIDAPEGQRHDTLELSRPPVSNSLLLYLKCDDQLKTIKVTW